MNHQAPLPMAMTGGQTATWLSLYVADDLAGEIDRVKKVYLRILLSGAAAADVVEVKLNGILLSDPAIEGNWRLFKTTPRQYAVGINLITIRMPNANKSVTIEKLEVHAAYKSE